MNLQDLHRNHAEYLTESQKNILLSQAGILRVFYMDKTLSPLIQDGYLKKRGVLTLKGKLAVDQIMKERVNGRGKTKARARAAKKKPSQGGLPGLPSPTA